jgi:hypothetical protein
LEQSATSGPRPKARQRPCLSQRSFPSSDGRRLGHLHRTPGATQMTKTNAAGTLSRKSVRTVRRSLILDARKLWRSCWRRCRKVQRSLFRKVPSSWNTPDIHSRSTIQSRSQQHLRKPRCGMRGDVPLGGLAAVLLGLRRCQAIAPHAFATIEARRAPQSILRPRR